MVDAADSKSAGSDTVRVRVSPWAPSSLTYSFICLALMKLSQGGVDQMVDQNEAYTFQKRGVFYFSKRVPSDLKIYTKLVV